MNRNVYVDVSTVDYMMVESPIVMVSMSEEVSFDFLNSVRGIFVDDRSYETW